jgi:hypothetical protein
MTRLIESLGHYLAHRKGLLPLLGCALVITNFILGLIAPLTWLSERAVFLHLGVIVAVLGLLLARIL